MTRLALLTPSYAPDLELCRDLNRSVLRWTPPDVSHHIIVPRRDRELFSGLRGPRTELWTVESLVPRRMLAVPRANAWVNLRRPSPPVRGWVMQQLVKLRLAAELEADVVLPVDSDVVLVRPVTAETFRAGDVVRFYRRDGGVHEGMPRHVLWHRAARRLLGLPIGGGPPFHDYVNPFSAWDSRLVVAMQRRIEAVTGRPWMEAMAAHLHVSEWTLYGVFVDEVAGAPANTAHAPSTPCHDYWGPDALDAPAAAAFVRGCPEGHVAILIQSTSSTPVDVRRGALAMLG
jgi:uncharacterized protein DUF6492